jgi:mevalonate kinase
MENSIIRSVIIPLSEYEFLKDSIQELQTFKKNNGYLIEEYNGYRHRIYYSLDKEKFAEKLAEEIKEYRKENSKLLSELTEIKSKNKLIQKSFLKKLFNI